MTTYKLSIWYAATINGSPDTKLLNAQQVHEYIRPEVGYLHDMIVLGGEGVRKITIEAVVE